MACVCVQYLRSLSEFQKTRSNKIYDILSLQNNYHTLPNNIQIKTLDILSTTKSQAPTPGCHKTTSLKNTALPTNHQQAHQ